MLITVDVESTGFTHNHIVELAASIRLDNGDSYQWLSRAKPSSLIEDGAAAVTGITNAIVANEKPDTEVVASFWADIASLCKPDEQVTLCGHNIAYDLRSLKKYSVIPAEWSILCTMKLARKYTPNAPNHKLVTLFQHLGIGESFDAHSALGDVVACESILFHYMGVTGLGYSDLAQGQAKPNTLKVVPFGKHKGELFSVVPASYMNYMLNLSDLDADVAHNFKQELARRAN